METHCDACTHLLKKVVCSIVIIIHRPRLIYICYVMMVVRYVMISNTDSVEKSALVRHVKSRNNDHHEEGRWYYILKSEMNVMSRWYALLCHSFSTETFWKRQYYRKRKQDVKWDEHSIPTDDDNTTWIMIWPKKRNYALFTPTYIRAISINIENNNKLETGPHNLTHNRYAAVHYIKDNSGTRRRTTLPLSIQVTKV